jgi:hypothetical protein
MDCSKCGEEMRMTENDTSFGRDFREYECAQCGHSDWEDRSSAFWKIRSEFKEEISAGKDDPKPIKARASQPAAPEPQPELPVPEFPTSEPEPLKPQPELWKSEPEWMESWWDRFGSWMGWGR